MRGLLRDIQDGTFANTWILENEAGAPDFKAMRGEGRRAPDREGRRGAAGDDAVHSTEADSRQRVHG